MDLDRLKNIDTTKHSLISSKSENNASLLIPSESFEECNHSKKIIETVENPSGKSGAFKNQTIPGTGSEPNKPKIPCDSSTQTEQSKSENEAESFNNYPDLKDGLETTIAQNSNNVSEEQSTFFENDSTRMNSQMDVDDPSSEAAEVLASLPNLIPVSDPLIFGFHNDKVQENCMSTCQESTIPQSKTESQTEVPQIIACQSKTNNEDISVTKHDLQEKGECKNCPTISHCDPKGKNIENTVVRTESKLKEPVWCDVGIFKGTSCIVTSYYSPSSRDPDHPNVISDNLPDFNNSLKIDLEPGTAYKFRICAINSCGRGPWSDVSAFRTSLPGYPGAPSSVSISRSIEGAHLSWQPPSNPAGNIIEYTVCLAVKNPSQAHGEHVGQKFTLMKVYNGPQTQTVVSNACLAEALIDTTSKPAIIFRIAAKNEKGFGPPTQVRWLQEVPDSKY